MSFVLRIISQVQVFFWKNLIPKIDDHDIRCLVLLEGPWFWILAINNARPIGRVGSLQPLVCLCQSAVVTFVGFLDADLTSWISPAVGIMKTNARIRLGKPLAKWFLHGERVLTVMENSTLPNPSPRPQAYDERPYYG